MRCRRHLYLATAAATVVGAYVLAGCDHPPDPVRKLVEPTPHVDPSPHGDPADPSVRVTLRDKSLTLGCVTSPSGHCNFLLISHAPNRIEAFSVPQGQGRDIERVGTVAFYCMDPQRSPDVDKCVRRKLWAALESLQTK